MIQVGYIIILYGITQVYSADYNYLNHGSDWGINNQVCTVSGVNQSPVDIGSKVTPQPDDSQLPYIIPQYSETLVSSTVAWDGKGLILKQKSTLAPWGYFFTVNAFGQSVQFKSVDMRVRCEAEHTFQGVRYPLELQISHSYTYGVVSSNKSAISVLFKEGTVQNPFLQKIINAYKPDQTITFTMTLNDIIPKTYAIEPYYYYQGSLTYPDCTEKTLWIIFERVLEATPEQIQFFYDLTHNNPNFIGEGNWRQTQSFDNLAKNIKVMYNPGMKPISQ